MNRGRLWAECACVVPCSERLKPACPVDDNSLSRMQPGKKATFVKSFLEGLHNEKAEFSADCTKRPEKRRILGDDSQVLLCRMHQRGGWKLVQTEQNVKKWIYFKSGEASSPHRNWQLNIIEEKWSKMAADRTTVRCKAVLSNLHSMGQCFLKHW